MDLSTFILKSIERNQVLDISQVNFADHPKDTSLDAFKNIIKTKLAKISLINDRYFYLKSESSLKFVLKDIILK
jgi:hypothetical protein